MRTFVINKEYNPHVEMWVVRSQTTQMPVYYCASRAEGEQFVRNIMRGITVTCPRPKGGPTA